jgi:hypothetical protein
MHEADHLDPRSYEFKNVWSFTSADVCLHGMVHAGALFKILNLFEENT